MRDIVCPGVPLIEFALPGEAPLPNRLKTLAGSPPPFGGLVGLLEALVDPPPN